MSSWFIICLLGLLFPKDGIVLAINDEEYSLQQFYDHCPKKQWASADSTKRDKIYTEFIKRELCILEAKKLSLDADPSVAVKIRSHSNQLLVNESYEQLVAFPLIDQDDIADARLFARQELFVNHILVGYSGAYLAQPPERSMDDALLLAQNIKNEFDTITFEKSIEGKRAILSEDVSYGYVNALICFVWESNFIFLFA